MMSVYITFLRGHLMRSSFAGKAAALSAILFILRAFCPQSAAAQQAEPILFHGVILDAETHQPLTGAHYRVRGLSSSSTEATGRSSGAADSRGMVSFYARHLDTVTFTCVGYKDYIMPVHDSLRAPEYVAGVYLTSDTLMMAAVVVMPRIGNLRSAIMSQPPATNQELINATNNLRLSAYQGLTSASKLGDPASNYEVLRQQQRYAAYEKGQIPADKMLGINPFTLISLIYFLAVGPPEVPEPPIPYITAREMENLRAVHDSLIYRVPR
jgi:hypothetical protein